MDTRSTSLKSVIASLAALSLAIICLIYCSQIFFHEWGNPNVLLAKLKMLGENVNG
ncbi:MAG: hypothetical protein ACRC0Q_13265 [Kurthia gibsonii]|uniref:hypothetical protein n=1 Tax=Kurthia TaxID=1649 RepID=UPI000745AF24|nr:MULTISPECIES: hypothetical protein [Kurthia]MCA9724925.1 hypothetical protein [Kurthia sp.]AMA63513.1 hypothetical protein ASO14_2677 [Kurthia sp. 11kri321]MEB6113109.1 hypothetical protein [Kurthia gibsonii]WIL38882.1 hypothetical protein QN089_01075 [Kurthia sp. YJT4]GED20645.1 hypothetical protein KGI01_23860 [Kurthia gibsonii]